MIHKVRVYDPSGKLQKVISQKALYKRSDKLIEDFTLLIKKGRPKGRPKDPPKGLPKGLPEEGS